MPPPVDQSAIPPSVVYLLKRFPRFSETFILNEILGLEALGVDVSICSLTRPTESQSQPQLSKIRARVVPLPEHLSANAGEYLRCLWCVFRRRPWRLVVTLAQAIASLHPTAVKRWAQAVWMADHLADRPHVGVHCHFALSAASVARHLQRINGNPYTFTAHAKDIFCRRVDRRLFQEKVDDSRGVIAVSDFSREFILKHLAPGRDGKVQRVHNGVDLGLFVPPPAGTRERGRLLAVGRLVEKKGFRILLDACEILRDRGVGFRLRICGDGPLRDALQERLETADLGGQVELLGALPQDAIRDELSRCALLLAPCLEASDGNLDALPTVLLEALATGTPCVSTSVSGIPEIITDGAEGLLVSPGDPQALADAIASLLRDDATREEMGARARVKAEQHFDGKRSVRAVARFLAQCHAPSEPVPVIRVGHIVTMFPRLSETFILREVRELESLGAEVTVFSQKRPRGGKRHGEAREIRAEVIFLSPWWRVLGPISLCHLRLLITSPRRYVGLLLHACSRRNLPVLKKFWRAARIAVAAKRRGIEHLHCHFMTGNARLAEFVTELVGIPHSITAHAKDIYASGLSETRVRRRLRDASFVATVSEFNRRHLLSLQPRAQVELIPNSVRHSVFEFSPRRPRGDIDALRVLAVGRLVPKKGFPTVIEAVAELVRSGNPVEVRIVGEGEDHDSLAALIATRGLRQSVKLTGAKSQEELRSDFAWADALVVPSVRATDGDMDGMPVVVLEAMALGVPVIASRLSGIPEVVVDGETGILVEPGCPHALAEALRRVRPPALNGLARAARRRVEERHDLTENCRHLLSLMHRAAARNGR